MTLNEQQIKDLYTFIDEIPTKFGVPLIGFFNSIAEEQKKLLEIEEKVEDKK